MAKKGKETRVKAIIPIFLVVIILFIGTLGTGIVLRQNLFDIQNSKDIIYDFKFIWGATPADLDQSISQWKLSNKYAPVTKPLGQNFIHLNYNIPANYEDLVLKVETGYCPVKILLNDGEILNNGYGTVSYTGNKLNVVGIPASTSDQKLDIYMDVPFDFEMNALLSPSTSGIQFEDISNYIGVILGIGSALLGLLFIILALLVSMRFKNLGNLILIGLALIVSSGAFVFVQLSMKMNSLAMPIFFRAQIASAMLAILSILFVMFNIRSAWKVIDRIIFIVALFAAVGLVVVEDISILKIVLVAFLLLLVYLTASVSAKIVKDIKSGVVVSRLLFGALIYASLVYSANILGYVVAINISAVEAQAIASLIVTSLVFMICLKKTINTNIRSEERELQLKKDTTLIGKAVSITSKVFIQKNKEKFFLEAAKGIDELIKTNVKIEKFVVNSDQEQVEESEEINIKFSMAVNIDGEYVEVYNEDGIQGCDYNKIAQMYLADENKSVYFGVKYMNIVFTLNKRIECIIHFENFAEQMSENLKNIINIAYSNISIALINLNLKTEMVGIQENTLIELAEIAEQKSGLDDNHLHIVSELVTIICKAMGLSAEETELVASAAIVHDIGKIAIPEAIISKEGKLTDEEYKTVKEHVEFGYNILSKSHGEFMKAAAVIAQQHHEKYDGTGYLGIKGKGIHLYARITSVADVFDALSTERAYKKAWPLEDVTKYINDRSGTDFDPEVVNAFNKCLDQLSHVREHYYKNPLEVDVLNESQN